MENEEELKKFFKYCVVKNDKEKLKQKLRESVSLRRKLIKKDDIELKDFWLFYLMDTELVKLIDYM